jgi:hypothetical protein
MEVLAGVLGELVEEETEKGIDIVAGILGVVHTAITVRVTDADRLLEEDDGGIGVPSVGVVNGLDRIGDVRGSELEEETDER